jgi:hypothetical protein
MPLSLNICVTTLCFDTYSFCPSLKLKGYVSQLCKINWKTMGLYAICFSNVKVPANRIVRAFELNNNKYFLNLFFHGFLNFFWIDRDQKYL